MSSNKVLSEEINYSLKNKNSDK